MNNISSKDKINKSTNYSQNFKHLVTFLILIKQLTRFIRFFDITLRWVYERVFFILQNHKLRTQNFTTLKARLFFFFRQWIRLSGDPSVRRLNAQCINNSLVISEGTAAEESRIHFRIFFRSCAFKLPASVSLLIPSVANQSSYFSVKLALKILFHETSGAWTYFSYPSGTTTVSIFFVAYDFLTVSSMWHS